MINSTCVLLFERFVDAHAEARAHAIRGGHSTLRSAARVCPRLFFRPCVSPPTAALSFAKMDRPISDEANLLLELHPVRAKWRDLGIALKMKQADLDAIEKDTTGAVDRALQNMLTQWLRSDEECTWSQIAEALDSAVVSEKKMAKSLRGKYCADYALESEGTTNNGGGGSGQV